MRKYLLRSLKDGIKRLSIYQGYVHGIMLKWVAAVTVLLALIHTWIVFASIPMIMQPFNFLQGVTAFTGMIYAFLIISALYSLASDLSQGGAQLFLSQPISRVTYVLAWILASLGTPTFIFVLSIVLPIVVIDPSLLYLLCNSGLHLLILETLELSCFIFLVACVSKNRGATLLVGLLLFFILPFMIPLLLMMIYSPIGAQPMRDYLFEVYAVFYPFRYALISFGRNINSASYVGTTMLMLTTFALILFYSKRRLEVT